MKIIIYFLQACCFILPVVTVIRLCRSNNGIEVDHVFLFSCGFIFYWIIPITLGNTHYFKVYESSYPLWISIFDNIQDNTWVAYFLCCLLFYISFIAGDLFNRYICKDNIKKQYSFNKKMLNMFLIINIALAIFFAYPMYQYLFIGYKKSTQIPALGSFTAATIMLLSLAFIYSAKAYEEDRAQLTFRKAIFNHFFVCYLFFAILLVSMGGRIIIISSLLMLTLFYSVYFKPVRPIYLIMFFCLLVILSHFILLFRSGYSLGRQLNPEEYYILKVPSFLLSENYNVSFSLLDFLNKYDFPLLRFPIALLSELITLIPSILLPTKNSFILRPDNCSVLSPAGGMNAFVSLLRHFGIIGSMVFLFLLSLGLAWLKRNPILPYSAIYIMASGWLGCFFFRDLQQTMIKEILEFSILQPLFITMICFKMNQMFSMKKRNSQ